MISIIHGDSMKPVLKDWSIVSIRKFDARCLKLQDLHIGDVILYESEGFDRDGHPLGHKEDVLHRIIRKDRRGWRVQAKGDNRAYAEWVSLGKVKGIMERVIL